MFTIQQYEKHYDANMVCEQFTKAEKLHSHFVRKTFSVQMCFSWVLMLQLQSGHDFMDKWTLVCRLASASITFITTIRTRHQAPHWGPPNTNFFSQATSWLLKEHNQGATLWHHRILSTGIRYSTCNTIDRDINNLLHSFLIQSRYASSPVQHEENLEQSRWSSRLSLWGNICNILSKATLIKGIFFAPCCDVSC